MSHNHIACMKFIFLFISLFLFTNIFAQECGYKDYNELVSLANKQSKNKEYKLANSTFKKAFSSVNFPLGQDLGNALSVANKTNDESWAKEIAVKLAKGGVPIRYFTKLYKMNWYKDFKANFKAFNLYYKSQYNQVLKNRWIALILKDRYFNLNRYHAHREGKIKITLEELIAEASDISTELKTIVETFGFPHEKQIGYLYIQGQNRVIDYRSDVLLRHIYQRGEVLFKDTEIDNLICSGNLRTKDVFSQKSIGFWYGLGLETVMEKFYNRYNKN